MRDVLAPRTAVSRTDGEDVAFAAMWTIYTSPSHQQAQVPMTASVLSRPTRALPAGARLIALAPDAAYAVRVLAAAAGGAALGTLAADGEDPSEHIVRGAASLSRQIVAHALGVADASPAASLASSARELERLIERVRRMIPASAAELMPTIDDPPLPLADEWLREAALERHEHALMLLAHPEYQLVLGTRALHPAEALARTAERVLHGVEGWASHDELLELEVEASYWFSERWAADADLESERGERSVTRRMEWVFADRRTLGLGEPILASLLASAHAEGWTPARRRAARALLDSETDAWHVFRSTGHETALARSLTNGREIAVRDPNGEALPGRVVMGRALPFGDEHVFALSTELVAADDPADLRALTADVRAFATSGRLPLAMAVEATIADGLFGARIPRRVPASEDADAALARIDEGCDLLLRRGVARTLDPQRGAPRPPTGTSRDLLALPDDPVIAAWMSALVSESSRERQYSDAVRRPA
jgi:hypothetical protein